MTNRIEQIGNIMTEKEAQKKLLRTFLYLPVPLVLFIVGGCWLGVRIGHPLTGGLLSILLGITITAAVIYVIFTSGHKEAEK